MRKIVLRPGRKERIAVAKGKAGEIFLDATKGGSAEFSFAEGSKSEVFIKSGNGRKLLARMVVGKDASLKIFSCGFGALEESVEIIQQGDGSRCGHYAIGMARGKQVLRRKSRHVHIGKNSFSRTVFKYIADSRAKVELEGEVAVEKNARGADTHLLLKGLMLGKGAEMKLLPLLNVHNNEVNAGHGAASSTVGAEEIFYLQSRGIDEKEAVALVAMGFLFGILDAGKFGADISKEAEREISGYFR